MKSQYWLECKEPVRRLVLHAAYGDAMADNVQMFVDFTGASADEAGRAAHWNQVAGMFSRMPSWQAAVFLEMAGGNVETAVEIYLNSQGYWIFQLSFLPQL